MNNKVLPMLFLGSSVSERVAQSFYVAYMGDRKIYVTIQLSREWYDFYSDANRYEMAREKLKVQLKLNHDWQGDKERPKLY